MSEEFYGFDDADFDDEQEYDGEEEFDFDCGAMYGPKGQPSSGGIGTKARWMQLEYSRQDTIACSTPYRTQKC